MNLEPIIQSEGSQKEKDKYPILTHIYSEILLSHKKKQNWVICGDVDRSRDLYKVK